MKNWWTWPYGDGWVWHGIRPPGGPCTHGFCAGHINVYEANDQFTGAIIRARIEGATDECKTRVAQVLSYQETYDRSPRAA